jgi:hypothetical protein
VRTITLSHAGIFAKRSYASWNTLRNDTASSIKSNQVEGEPDHFPHLPFAVLDSILRREVRQTFVIRHKIIYTNTHIVSKMIHPDGWRHPSQQFTAATSQPDERI